MDYEVSAEDFITLRNLLDKLKIPYQWETYYTNDPYEPSEYGMKFYDDTVIIAEGLTF